MTNLNTRLKFLSVIILFSFQFIFSQVKISLENENGVYKVPCKVNGIPMKFIFDTGASNVSISLTEAQFLYKQGLLDQSDILNSEKYKIANGDIIEGTKINIKTISINEITLTNIEASVVHSQNAPLLLGLSAIKKLGKISIENNILYINNNSSNSKEIDETISWINNKFLKNQFDGTGFGYKKYYFENIETINNEPYLILIESGEEKATYKIPLKKINPITFKNYNVDMFDKSYEYYVLEITTKNEEFEIIELSGGAELISNRTLIYLNKSIEDDDLISRFKNAFKNLMSQFGNDGKEKF